MIRVERHREKIVYVILDPLADMAYVGATFSLKARLKRHRESGSLVAELLLRPDTIVHSTNPMPLADALEHEDHVIEGLIECGFFLFNQRKGGSPGGMSIKWTEANILAAKGTYRTRNEMAIKAAGLYHRLMQLGRLDEFFQGVANDGYATGKKFPITKKSCANLARAFLFRKDFIKAHPAAGRKAHEMGWMDEIFEHSPSLGYKNTPKGRWSLEACRAEATKYETREEFSKKAPSAYTASHRGGWLDEIFRSHKWRGYKLRPSDKSCRGL
jgi:predicted GIY-YIG superfamily endonuclease